jgi:hypothetical protein
MAQMAILEKFARNAEQLGLTVNSRSGTSVVIENGSNDLTISLVDAEIMKPMGGIDNTATPFLGVGVANPCKIKMKSAITTADTIADVIDSTVAIKVFKLLCGFANDIVLENSDAAYTLTLRGHADLIGVGQ